MKRASSLKHLSQLRKGFTLMEMVMVMAIIAVLVGGVISFIGDASGGAKIQKAESEIQTLSAKVLEYKTLAGRYPTTEQGLKALTQKPTTAPKPRRYPNPPYLKALPNDPWGNPYGYKMPGSKDSSTFEIISYGSDGKPGGDDDISSQDDPA